MDIKTDGAVGSAAENPGLSWVEHNVKDSKIVDRGVSAKDLERNDEGVGDEVVVDGAVEDLDGSIVGGRGEEWVLGVVANGANGV